VDLARRTLVASPLGLRAVLMASREYLVKGDTAKRLAACYAAAGIESVDLRLSPLGGEDESVRKVRSALEIVRVFRDGGLQVHLGYQGHLGQTALALGLVEGFSVGVGMREQINHASAIARQAHPRDDDELAGVNRGALAGVHLSEAAATIPRGTDQRDSRRKPQARGDDCMNPLRVSAPRTTRTRSSGRRENSSPVSSAALRRASFHVSGGRVGSGVPPPFVFETPGALTHHG
jgi:hypothetical protein